MTIEEKAKAYDEALERAREMCATPTDKATMEYIFPQLRESEDERIRKEINALYSEIDTCITELLKARTDKDSEAEGKALFKMEGLMVATLQDLSCIEDYLEKQKEYHIPWYDYQKSKEAGYTIVPNEDYEQLMKQKEQKPAEYEQAEKDIVALIESRLSEIIGDAQPKPALRAELEELIKRIKDGQN